LPALAVIDRQIAAAQKQLMAFFKELERRQSKWAEPLQTASLKAVSRARPQKFVNREEN
jgi:hypothetical protein